ncbi:MAG: glutathione S-transferase family protein [Sphingopyxis sp.]|nr:glutathione S-transferase family protein [Sphingopyxis sp.]
MADVKQLKSRFEVSTTSGRFVRKDAAFRNWITADGSPGPSGEGGFAAEPGRYHLYISAACPWAHRTRIFRKIKGLEAMISMSVTHWFMGGFGWTFEPGGGVVPDPILGAVFVSEIYQAADSQYDGRFTVPLLWDRKRATIVSNESSEIIRMFNSAFDGAGAIAGDYYPAEHRAEIDAINLRVYETLNNGVYKAGFAATQEAYEETVVPLFETLDWLEERLTRQRYLVGDSVTEADWRLLPTLLRFDAVYVGHFKCNLRRLIDYPSLSAYTRELYQWPGIRETVDFDHIKRHYFESHKSINPLGVVPLGPLIDFDAPHHRDR